MFKVYGIYSGNKTFFSETFFIKINRSITWIKADLKFNEQPYFSNEKISGLIEKSALAKKFSKLKEGESLDVKYGSCSNHYRIVKMTEQEIFNIQELHDKKKELEKVKNEMKINIPNEINEKIKKLTKEFKNLKSQTV